MTYCHAFMRNLVYNVRISYLSFDEYKKSNCDFRRHRTLGLLKIMERLMELANQTE